MCFSLRFHPVRLRKAFLSLPLLLNPLMPHPAQAQTGSITARVPFAFQGGKQEMPAGDYRITYKSPHMILIQSRDSKHFTYTMVHPEQRGRSAMPGKLVFYRVGGRLFLKEIWAPEQTGGCKLVKTDMETKLLADSLFRPGADAQLALLEVPVR